MSSFDSSPDFASWRLDDVTPPWDDRPSIYEHLRAHLLPQAGLADGGERLPDEERVRAGQPFGWAPGAMDGVLGHHLGTSDEASASAEVLNALAALIQEASDTDAAALYTRLLEHRALAFVDPLLQAVVGGDALEPERVHAIAHWLATRAPDREPVKVGIALLGLFAVPEDREVLLTLGRHDEFTLFAAVALANSAEKADRALWELGRSVTGWGRVHVVERLAATQDEHIQAWLLREGYRNDIMVEYTALTCATAGGLLAALQLPHPDQALMVGAGEILTALMRDGSPAGDMGDYPDGAAATELYLAHLRDGELTLAQFVAVAAIADYVARIAPEEGSGFEWWQRREIIRGHADAILHDPRWPARVQTELASDDPTTFHTAAAAARVLGIDTWEVYFARLERGEALWYQVMQSDDPRRIARVAELAAERLPLDALASGPADEVGLGPAFQQHQALDFVLQGLRDQPGLGWPLVRAGLRSPVVRNRNLAIRALDGWGRAAWPPEAEPLLRRALGEEPNADTREWLRRVLAGEPLDPPDSQ